MCAQHKVNNCYFIIFGLLRPSCIAHSWFRTQSFSSNLVDILCVCMCVSIWHIAHECSLLTKHNEHRSLIPISFLYFDRRSHSHVVHIYWTNSTTSISVYCQIVKLSKIIRQWKSILYTSLYSNIYRPAVFRSQCVIIWCANWN